jgi:dTMP kinase
MTRKKAVERPKIYAYSAGNLPEGVLKAEDLPRAEHAIPPVHPFDTSNVTGRLIVVEGSDGSGRSTQISLLQEWLEANGFPVVTSGLRRSRLVGSDIDRLLEENSVTPTTLALMYATDFYDQLQNQILPALASGAIVLADRYVYSLSARAAVRGIATGYLDTIYQLALKPDVIFWLNLSPETAFEREFRKYKAIKYWESGRDLALSNDLRESFLIYQRRIKQRFARMAKKHGFVEIDGEESVRAVNSRLRRNLASLLGIRGLKYEPSDAMKHLLVT